MSWDFDTVYDPGLCTERIWWRISAGRYRDSRVDGRRVEGMDLVGGYFRGVCASLRGRIRAECQ